MTSFFAIAIAVLGVVVAFNLFCTAALARRVRAGGPAHSAPPPAPQTPKPVPVFTATSDDGSILTEADLAVKPAIVAFFSSSCSPCQAQLPQFAALAAGLPRGQAITVVIGDDDNARQMLTTAAERTVAVGEGDFGAIAASFGVDGFPSYLQVEDGMIVSSAHHYERLRWPTNAAKR